MTFDLDLYISGHSAMTVIKLLNYDISCRICFTAHTVLDEFFPNLFQMITNMRGYVAHNDLDLYLQYYLAATLPILWIIFICGTNTSHEGTMCYVPF